MPLSRGRPHPVPVPLLLAALLSASLLLAAAPSAGDRPPRRGDDPYAGHVWPPPPDRARIKLDAVITGRRDVEGRSRLSRLLIGASPAGPYDLLRKPHAVAFDGEGRILVTDWAAGALLRFDRRGGRLDVFGTRGSTALRRPLGLCVGPEGRIYVADVGLRRVVAFGEDGAVVAVYGGGEALTNPTDAAVSPDGRHLLVADSKAHRIVVFDLGSGRRVAAFGHRGDGPGAFNHPTSLAFGPGGLLHVVDQLNARVQVLTASGEHVATLGRRGRGPGQFTRPKDVAVDGAGWVYVTDNAFNNVQLFTADHRLLTFVGSGGSGPGEFLGASGVAVRGDEMAVVDQLGRRLQVFRFLVPKEVEPEE